jgi:hypothetical protein
MHSATCLFRGTCPARWPLAATFLAAATPAHASFFHGEVQDSLANAISWVVIFFVPAVAIALFWFVHILPEKIAAKRLHPQTGAIKCLCLLSLVFGGLLWPIALIWACTKPVLYKIAYGTDTDASVHPAPAAPAAQTPETSQKSA